MRQIVYGEQWIHPEIPTEIREVFLEHGTFRKFKKGEELLHGGPYGEITLLTKGLCLYRFWDWQDKEHVFSVIIPNRTMGDIDGACCNVANVCAFVAQDSEGLVLPYSVWHREIFGNHELLAKFTSHVVIKQECHIEALLACFTMNIDFRLRSLFHALIKAYGNVDLESWNPLPVRLNTVLISKIISSSRTSVSLTLGQWEEEGKLKRDKKTMYLHGRVFKELYDWWENSRE